MAVNAFTTSLFATFCHYFKYYFVLVLKEGLMIYDYIMAMTSGGPAGATESITLSIYRIGFEDMKFGYAISQAMIVAVIIAVISITQIRFTDKKKIYD